MSQTFNFDHLSAEQAIGLFPELNLDQVDSVAPGEGTVTLYIKSGDLDDMFQVAGDVQEVDDVESTDLQYKHNNASTDPVNNWLKYYTDVETTVAAATTSVGSSSSFRSDLSTAPGADRGAKEASNVSIVTGHASGFTTLATIGVSNLAKDYTGNYSTDLFTNENALLTDNDTVTDLLADQVASSWASVVNNNNGVYSDATSIANGNLAKGIFEKLANAAVDANGEGDAHTRFQTLIDAMRTSDAEAGVFTSIAFQANDIFEFTITYKRFADGSITAYPTDAEIAASGQAAAKLLPDFTSLGNVEGFPETGHILKIQLRVV